MTQVYSAKNLVENYLNQIKKKYESADQDVAPELRKLSRTQPPSLFAFFVVTLYGIIIDIINVMADFTIPVLVNLCIAILYYILIRAFINRRLSTQRILAFLLLLGLIIEVFLPGIGTIFSATLLLFVLLFGVRNPGVAVSNVNKEKIVEQMQGFQKSILIARGNAARIIRLGRKVPGLRTMTTKIARSKIFRAFSKSTKVTGRLLGSVIAESITLLDWLPLSTLNGIWTYKQLKAGHRDANELAKNYQESRQVAEEYEVALARAQVAEQVITGIPITPISSPAIEAPRQQGANVSRSALVYPRVQTQASV